MQTHSRLSLELGTDLESRLRALYVRHRDHRETTEVFLPRGCVERIICPETVKAELSGLCPDGELDLTARKICADYRDVFAILVLINAVPCVFHFLDPATGVSDADLPLDIRETTRGSYTLRRVAAPDTPLDCFRNWKQNTIRSFEREQWAIKVPFLGHGRAGEPQHYDFPAKTILPLLEMDDPPDGSSQDGDSMGATSAPILIKCGQGGYSKVSPVKIHPDHENFRQQGSPLVSDTCGMKVLDPSHCGENSLHHEAEMLRSNSGGSDNMHPHLIPLLASWKQADTYVLLFPWAKCDLLRLWESQKGPPLFCPEMVLWMIKQCTGIADGLGTIHDYKGSIVVGGRKEATYGRHGDVKPENILCFEVDGEPRGRLVLSDYGFAQFNSRESTSNISNNRVGYTPGYQPPEMVTKGAKVSRSFDIWTLGCLYLEFLVWLLGGWDQVVAFEESRMRRFIWGNEFMTTIFFDIAEDHGRKVFVIKEAVANMIAELHSHAKCSQFVHDFLDLIEERMLIVESPGRKRARCEVVHAELKSMLDRCAADISYGISPCPWPLVRIPPRTVPAELSETAQDCLCRYKVRLPDISGRRCVSEPPLGSTISPVRNTFGGQGAGFHSNPPPQRGNEILVMG